MAAHESPDPVPAKVQPVTAAKIPGTEIPDVDKAAEPAEQKRWMSRVAVSTAVMAAMAAIAGSMATSHLNQAMFEQIAEADQWGYYQAKGIKHAILESRMTLAEAAGKPPSEADASKLKAYDGEQVDIKKDAELHKSLAENHLHRHARLSMAITALQIGIGLAAVALLLKRNVYWALALAGCVVGAVLLVMGLLGA